MNDGSIVASLTFVLDRVPDEIARFPRFTKSLTGNPRTISDFRMCVIKTQLQMFSTSVIAGLEQHPVRTSSVAQFQTGLLLLYF